MPTTHHTIPCGFIRHTASVGPVDLILSVAAAVDPAHPSALV